MKHVMIAEDDVEMRTLLARELRARGFEVTAVEDGARVLYELEDKRPDVFVLDVWMPVLSGIDVLKLLRADGYSTPVVLMTAACDDEVIDAAEKHFASVVFDKPVEPSLLCEAVEIVMHVHRNGLAALR